MLKQLFYSGPSIEVLHEEYAKKGRIDARAPVGAAGEIRIEAPVGRVWELLVNVPAWGTWGRAVAAPRAPVSILLASGGVQLLVFGSAAAALYATGRHALALTFAVLVVANVVLASL